MSARGALAALCVLASMLLFMAPAHPKGTAPEPMYAASKAHGEKGHILWWAHHYLGTPYNKYTWSCSDFTSAVYGNATGVWMPDWDDKQRFYGYHPASLRRGDLVFFKEHKGDGPVTHVAVYVGGGYVIQSSLYWGSTVKTYMPYIKGFRPEYTRRIR